MPRRYMPRTSDEDLVAALEEVGPGPASELARLLGRDQRALERRLVRLCESGLAQRRLLHTRVSGRPYIYWSKNDPFGGP